MSTLVANLVETWRRQGIKIVAGATISDIQKFEAENAVTVPPSVRNYYATVNGMGQRGTQSDDDFFDFWRIEDCRSVNHEFPKSQLEDYFLFADHSIGLVYYAVHFNPRVLEADDVIAIYPPYEGDEAPLLTFSTFDAFINAYLDGPIRNFL